MTLGYPLTTAAYCRLRAELMKNPPPAGRAGEDLPGGYVLDVKAHARLHLGHQRKNASNVVVHGRMVETIWAVWESIPASHRPALRAKDWVR